MYAYSNNGQSFRAWDAPNNLLDGEVYFDHEPTETELAAAFTGYTATLKQQKLDALNAEYEAIYQVIRDSYSSVYLTDGTNVETKQLSLQTQYMARVAEKKIKKAVILNG